MLKFTQNTPHTTSLASGHAVVRSAGVSGRTSRRLGRRDGICDSVGAGPAMLRFPRQRVDGWQLHLGAAAARDQRPALEHCITLAASAVADAVGYTEPEFVCSTMIGPAWPL